MKPIRLATPKSSAAQLGLISRIVLLTSSLKGQELLCEFSAQHAAKKGKKKKRACPKKSFGELQNKPLVIIFPMKNHGPFRNLGISIHLWRNSTNSTNFDRLGPCPCHESSELCYILPERWRDSCTSNGSQLWLQAAIANGEIHPGNSRNFKCHHPKSDPKKVKNW